MDRTKTKRIQQIIVCVCIVAVVAFLTAMPLLAKQKPAESGPKASILSGTVQRGQINTELVSGGALAEEEAVSVSIPAEVKLKSFLVRDDDPVAAGTPIAEVDRVTVMTAISKVQETLDHLTGQIKKAGKADGEDTLTALTGGTVKILHAKKGDSVRDVMLEHGALAVLSMDGLLAVDIKTDSDIRTGKPMTVSFDDGRTVTGHVAKNLNGVMTVTIEDRDYNLGDMVGIRTVNEVFLGRGALYIYSPWKATAYAGTVSEIKVGVGDKLRSGDTLMTLTDVGQAPAYRQLVSQRQEYENLMLELFKMYQTETVTAPCDGIISGINEDCLQLLSAGGSGYTIQLLANAPNGNDEILYVNHVGKVAAVGSNGWSLLVNPQPVTVADYAQVSALPVDVAAMTQVCTYPVEQQQPDDPAEGETPQPQQAAPIYAMVDGAWQQIPASSVAAGDILLFASDDSGALVWIVRISTAETGGTPSRPSGNGGFGGMTGGFPSGGVTKPEPEFKLYGLDMLQIAAVTPQNTVTLPITVDELDIRALHAGMTAQVKIHALGTEKHTATIKEIGNLGANNGGSSKFTVTLTMERTREMLSGMNATATIVLSGTKDVLTVPAAALVERGGQTVVYTGYDKENDKLINPVTVKVGCSDGETVEILEGLAEDQTYYYAYYDTLKISATPDFGGNRFG